MGESFVDRVTQVWVRVTGRPVRLEENRWLDGPVGDTDVIGETFFHRFAARGGLTVDGDGSVTGLLPTVSLLDGPDFDSNSIHPQVADFYQQTSRYSFDVTPEWSGGLRPVAWMIFRLFGKRLRQLNAPLSSKDTSGGASSEVFAVRREGRHLFSAWIRTLESTGNILYAGAYSTARLPGHDGPCIKVVFPLPNGSAMVFMRPELQKDGSLMLRSEGTKFGDPGFYFYVRRDDGGGVARYVPALRESIHVCPGEAEAVQAEHVLSFWGRRFLTQHYRSAKGASA